MYYLKKTVTVSGAHRLSLPYESPCRELHGHNWVITVHCRAEKVNSEGMVVDFVQLKRIVMSLCDHKEIRLDGRNPTAENIAFVLCNSIPNCYRVDVEETPGSVASYEIPSE